MPDPFKQGDDARNKYLEQALHANAEAAGEAKFTDLYNKESSIYKDPNANQPKPEPKPIPEKPTVDEEGLPIIEPMRTYKEDLAGVVRADKLSLSRIAMMQDTANKGLTNDIVTPPKKQVNILLIISIALIVLGIGIAGGVLMLAVDRGSIVATPETKAPIEKYIVFSETTKPLPIGASTKTEIGAQISLLIADFREEGSFMEVIPTYTVLKTETTNIERASAINLFNTTNARMPDDLARSISDRFFLGLYSLKGIAYPFMLYYVDSYDIAYPGMLDWEGFMPDDMSWLFPLPPRSGTTTPKLSFKDRVIANSDARSYEDAQGRTAFFYIFLDDHTILMARTADTVRMVEDRLRQAKFQ